jgi:hypothetical protein
VLDNNGLNFANRLHYVDRRGVDGYFTDSPVPGESVRDQAIADLVRSPQNPAVLANTASANLGSSRGFEGLAISPDKGTLWMFGQLSFAQQGNKVLIRAEDQTIARVGGNVDLAAFAVSANFTLV